MKLLVLILAAVVLVSAGKGGGDKSGPDPAPEPLAQVVRFCKGVTSGDLINTEASLDDAFATLNDSCADLFEFFEDDGDDGDDVNPNVSIIRVEVQG